MIRGLRRPPHLAAAEITPTMMEPPASVAARATIPRSRIRAAADLFATDVDAT